MKYLSAAIVALVLGQTQLAFAHHSTYVFCATIFPEYVDAGFGESIWNDNSTVRRPIIGVKAQVFKGSTSWFSDYLNADGCTYPFQMSDHTNVTLSVESWGFVAGVDLQAMNGSGDFERQEGTFPVVPTNGGTVTGSFAPNARMQAYSTIAFLLQDRFRGGVDHGIITIHTTGGSACPCGVSPNGSSCEITSTHQEICIPGPLTQNKNLMAHEYGHAILAMATSNAFAIDYGSDGIHDFGSQEVQSVAIIEGWADFVMMDAWNDHSAQNGNAFAQWSQTSTRPTGCNFGFGNPDAKTCPTPSGVSEVDVLEAENSGCYDDCVTKFMEARYPAASWPARGVETDWMRTLWDYHTNGTSSGGGVVPTHARLMAEFGASGTLGTANAYDRYRRGVASNSGCAQYNRFVFSAAANGADHCDGTCDDVSGCTDCDSTCCGFTPCN